MFGFISYSNAESCIEKNANGKEFETLGTVHNVLSGRWKICLCVCACFFQQTMKGGGGYLIFDINVS